VSVFVLNKSQYSIQQVSFKVLGKPPNLCQLQKQAVEQKPSVVVVVSVL